MTTHKVVGYAAGFILAGLLTACGGGGGGGSDGTSSSSGSNSSAGSNSSSSSNAVVSGFPVDPQIQTPPSTGTPTALFSKDLSTATSLVNKVKAAMLAMVQIAPTSNVSFVANVPEFTALDGTVATKNKACSIGGSVAVAIQNPTSATTLPSGFNRSNISDCSEISGISESGAIASFYTKSIDDNNFTYTNIITDYSVKVSGVTYGPYSRTDHCAVVNTVESCYHAINGQAIIGHPSVTYSGNVAGVSNGVVHSFYDGTSWIEISSGNGWEFDRTTGVPATSTLGVVNIYGGGSLYSNYATVEVNSLHTGYVVKIHSDFSTFSSFTVAF
jgi:hypothetical protein